MVEFYLIMTEVELCVLNYFFERGGSMWVCIVTKFVGHSQYDKGTVKYGWILYDCDRSWIMCFKSFCERGGGSMWWCIVTKFVGHSHYVYFFVSEVWVACVLKIGAVAVKFILHQDPMSFVNRNILFRFANNVGSKVVQVVRVLSCMCLVVIEVCCPSRVNS